MFKAFFLKWGGRDYCYITQISPELFHHSPIEFFLLKNKIQCLITILSLQFRTVLGDWFMTFS